jgi:hypothetical protein
VESSEKRTADFTDRADEKNASRADELNFEQVRAKTTHWNAQPETWSDDFEQARAKATHRKHKTGIREG